MAGEIKKALEEATEKADKNQESPELSSRVKKLLARKKRLQRKTNWISNSTSCFSLSDIFISQI